MGKADAVRELLTKAQKEYISIKPTKGNEELKSKLQTLANAEKRSLHEFVQQILIDYTENPHPVFV